MLIINTEKRVIKSWCNNPEVSAMDQAKAIANLPFTFHHVALMPDCHTGYGMPIGGVLATEGVVVPNAVGVDIGCGMLAAKTGIKAGDLSIDAIKDIMSKIRERIPVGVEHHKEDMVWEGFNRAPDVNVVQNELSAARRQLGTLGGGNHFIELQRDSDNNVWVMLHSGSRNFGYKIAKYYNARAQELCTKWHSNIPALHGEDGLAFLPVDTVDGEEYLSAMLYAMEFAKASRMAMLTACFESIGSRMIDPLDVPHNYANLEYHFGRNVWVHRKGATMARNGFLGIIPGSQGTASYIVKGKGNPESFCSCSHGAGRCMSRNQARAELSVDAEIKKLDDLGIIHAIRSEKDLDESPSAYKDINTVMAEQSDLVDIVTELKPIAVMKG